MSWRHSKAAGELPLSRPPAKAVLMALAHHANEYDGTCYPSIKRIVLFTSLSERSVQGALNELEQAGHIKRWVGGGKKATVYQLTLDAAPLLTQGQQIVNKQGTQGVDPPPQEVRGSKKSPPQEMHPTPAGGAGDPRRTCGLTVIEQSSKKDSLKKGPVPEDWWPEDSAIKDAMKELPNVDITTETRQFIDYNTSHGNEFASIGAAWRAWLRRAKPGAGARGSKRAAENGGLDRLRELASGAGAQRPS